MIQMLTLNELKETLRLCSSSLSSQPSSSNLHQIESTNPRKPPKSSLFKQLQRLGDPTYNLQLHHRKDTETQSSESDLGANETVRRTQSTEQKEEDKSKSVVRHFDHTGPFEPLVLSPPGELPLIQVPPSINCRLLEHQREGVKFLYNLYKNNHGGVLGDDMGLGKTIQTIAFLSAVYGKEEPISVNEKGPTLVLCPSSVIHNWETEFSKWSTFDVVVCHGATVASSIDRVERRSSQVLITSFDTFRMNESVLAPLPWEVMVVDEAHRLKNERSKLYASCSSVATRRRIGLTGTVMQNRIAELFNLFDWAAPGSLGTREHFRGFYDEPLRQGQRSTAPERSVRVADERRRHLSRLLRRYMLRRTKEETIGHLMMGKEDNVVFCEMSEAQRRAYQRVLRMPDVQCLVNRDEPCRCGSALTRSECCHRTVPDGVLWRNLHRDAPEGCDSCPFCLVLPCLVKLQQISNHLELVRPNPRDDTGKQARDAEFAAAALGCESDGGAEGFVGLSDAAHCGKMRVLERLMVEWTSGGDKILLFSYSVRMLDVLEKFLIRRGYCFSRLDGSTPTGSRQSLVDGFNASPSKQVFLISTRAGGLGLNLATANRVVIFDPNWNPSQDLQAQDRSFRFGQKRHVIIFRLLAAGSLEELIYTRQVYKQQLSNIAVSGTIEERYFEGVQDCKRFKGELFGICNLFRDLSDRHFTSDIIGLPRDSPDLGCLTAADAKEDLGIVCTHRNEDVVNTSGSEGGDRREKKKRLVFGRIARFMGMDELQFSKWLLLASPLQRQSVLLDYEKGRVHVHTCV